MNDSKNSLYILLSIFAVGLVLIILIWTNSNNDITAIGPLVLGFVLISISIIGFLSWFIIRISNRKNNDLSFVPSQKKIKHVKKQLLYILFLVISSHVVICFLASSGIIEFLSGLLFMSSPRVFIIALTLYLLYQCKKWARFVSIALILFEFVLLFYFILEFNLSLSWKGLLIVFFSLSYLHSLFFLLLSKKLNSYMG